ncbi:unannotated protein [freshwater metagenome]|uniref:Unannotated protein n=1 Tax=freshwater metagenome TaxID=449393 RepID=A0A6J7Q9I6_9ZZZZ
MCTEDVNRPVSLGQFGQEFGVELLKGSTESYSGAGRDDGSRRVDGLDDVVGAFG